MDADESKHLWSHVQGLLRQPDPPSDAEARRALAMLLSARPDAPYLMLHRVLVLERALADLRARSVAAPAGTAGAPAVVASGGRFLRDAATITAGVVAGGLLLGGIDAALGDDAAAAAEGAVGLGLGDLV